MSLPPSLRSKYYIDGHFSPVKIFSDDEMIKINKDYQRCVEKLGKDGVLEGDHRFKLHLLAKWAHQIVTPPAIVSAVKTVLDSPNIICWSSDLNIKSPRSRGHIPWHQDCAYSGLEPSDKVVTVWLALTQGTPDNGALSMWSGSHGEQLRHETGDSDPDNTLILKQRIPDTELEQLDMADQVLVTLEPGEVSLHSWRCVHKSGPNTTDQERVGLAIRYMTDEVQNIKSVVRERAMLICGSGGQWWDLEEKAPKKDYGEKEREAHQESMEREKKNYLAGQESQEYK